MFQCRPTIYICGSQITLWINWKQMTLDECLWDPKTTVTQISLSLESSDTQNRLPAKIHCHWNSSDSQNRLSLDFHFQPKTTVVWFLVCINVMHWHSNSTIVTSICSPILDSTKPQVAFQKFIACTKFIYCMSLKVTTLNRFPSTKFYREDIMSHRHWHI